MSSKLLTEAERYELEYAATQLGAIRALAEAKLNYFIRKLTGKGIVRNG